MFRCCLSPRLTSSLAALQPDILWPVCEVVCYPCHQVLLHLQNQELLSKAGLLYSFKGTGEVKEHDPHRVLRSIHVHISSVKQMDDGIPHTDASLISKLQRVRAAANKDPEVL